MFGLLVLVGLFIALTPGILFRLKGSKMVSAAMHAVLFGLVLYVVSMYGSSYGVSYEGFQDPAADWAAAKERYDTLKQSRSEATKKLKHLREKVAHGKRAENDLPAAEIEVRKENAAWEAETPVFKKARADAIAAGVLEKTSRFNTKTLASTEDTAL